jgi:hypothetical protein
LASTHNARSKERFGIIMPTACTPEMPISTKTISSSHKITLRLRTPYLSPLFLGLVTIQEVPTMSGVTGIINPGTDASHGGTAALQVDSPTYNNLVSFLSNNTGLELEICYDTVTLVPNEVSCGSTLPLIAPHQTAPSPNANTWAAP